jgi:hypothetical protein
MVEGLAFSLFISKRMNTQIFPGEIGVDIEILNENRLRYWCGRIQLPDEAVIELARLAVRTQQNEALLNIFSAFYEKVVLNGNWSREEEDPLIDPQVTQLLGEKDSLFYLLGYLAALPHAEKEYLRRGIDLAIFDDTMQDIRTWLVHCHEVYDKWMFNQFHWVSNHLSCTLFRLGRMQYQLNAFDYAVKALKRKSGGEYIILADPQLPLRADGCAFGAGDLHPAGEPWQPVFEETESGWRGNPVAPLGYALREVQFFDRSEWDLVLQQGDTVLDMHIPRKDRFSMDDCQISLTQAFQFFQRYYPERPFKACACHTWFFSPQLQQIAPIESNIVRFQREFYLFPFTGKLAFLWFYVFGEGVKDRSTAPAKTTLQRAVLDWLDHGGEIFDLPGVMFHGPESWGTQPYMREFEAKS